MRALQIRRPTVMTRLYVRDESGFREAQPTDVLDRAQPLLAQRYRVGSPVLSSPALTREFVPVHLGACERDTTTPHARARLRLIRQRGCDKARPGIGQETLAVALERAAPPKTSVDSF